MDGRHRTYPQPPKPEQNGPQAVGSDSYRGSQQLQPRGHLLAAANAYRSDRPRRLDAINRQQLLSR